MKKLANILIVVSLALALGQTKSFVQSGIAAPLWVEIVKTANPPHVNEPGGLVNFTVTITSSWPSTLTLTSLIDNIHGDLNGQGTCSVPQTLSPGATYTCTFSAMVTGKPGYSETDTVTVNGKDVNGNPFNASAFATVDVLDVLPVIAVTKTANPTQVKEPGGIVNFTVLVENKSVTSDPVTITSLTDSIHGDLKGQGTCSVPQTIQPGASYSCTFPATVNGKAGDSETDVVTASGTDDEGTPASASGQATVTVIAQLYKVYFPTISSNFKDKWDVTTGYEDLPIGSPLMDFDYNDFTIAIHSVLTYEQQIINNLRSVNFVLTPESRGAVFDHEFHIFIAANTFKSDGVATITIFDQNHNVISSQPIPLVASKDNDFLIFSRTSAIFPEMSNTIETKPRLKPQRTAELNIEFTTPFYFNLADYPLADEHGTGMFFDPYLKVLNTGQLITHGDDRMLVVKDLNWMWPEEGVRIDRAYPLTSYEPGPPPHITFPDGWWLNHNTCVYGDGIPCPAP